MTFWEIVILITLLVCIVYSMYYCYFKKMRKIEESLSPDYRGYTSERHFYNRDERSAHNGEIFTITANGIVLREASVANTLPSPGERNSKLMDLPPSYEEVVRNLNGENSRSNNLSQ